MSLMTVSLVMSLGQHSPSVYAKCSVNTWQNQALPLCSKWKLEFFRWSANTESVTKVRVSDNNPSQTQTLLSFLPWSSQVKPWGGG